MASDIETGVITKDVKCSNILEMMDANSGIMEEIANDSKLNAVEKMRGFSMGVRNQCLLSRDQQARIKMLATLGVKATNATKALTFTPDVD